MNRQLSVFICKFVGCVTIYENSITLLNKGVNDMSDTKSTNLNIRSDDLIKRNFDNLYFDFDMD
jgi:hypothetical protein